jgi:hypothetical protein
MMSIKTYVSEVPVRRLVRLKSYENGEIQVQETGSPEGFASL